MKLYLGLWILLVGPVTEGYLIFDPPRPSRRFEHLLVIGTTVGEERMFVYTNHYLIRGENQLLGSLSFSAFWIYLQGDWEIFVGNKDKVTLTKQKLNAEPNSFDRIPLLETGEVITVDFKPPPQFLFLKAKAPAPRFKRWLPGEESFYPPRIFFPAGDPATNMQPREAEVIMDRTRREN